MPRRIYRTGQDIYDASTNTKIGATDWANNWSGKSDVVDMGQKTTSPKIITAKPYQSMTDSNVNLLNQNIINQSDKKTGIAPLPNNGNYSASPLPDANVNNYSATPLSNVTPTYDVPVGVNANQSTTNNQFGTQTYDQLAAEQKKVYDSLSDGTDPGLKSLIDSIKSEYDSRAKEIGQSNTAAVNTVKLAGGRSGTSDYAPEIQAGMITAEENAGVQRIKTLRDQEIQTLQSASDAYKNNKMTQFNTYMNNLRQIQNDKNTAIKDQLALVRQGTQDAIANAKSSLENLQLASNVSDKLVAPLYDDFLKTGQWDTASIDAMAKQYNIPASTLYSSALNYKSTKDKENIVNAGNYADILSKTSVGGTVNIPGLGNVTIEGNGKTLKTDSGEYYQQVGGKWVNTGIPTSISTKELLDAASKITDPDVYANILRAYGLKGLDDEVGDGISSPEGATGGSISWRTNNPGNIKWTGAPWQIALGAVDSGIKATDGGSFARFPNIDAGTQAQKQLLSAPSYANLTLDAAMKRWSNNGYGADVAPSLNPNEKMSSIMVDPNKADTLMAAMKKREGFTPGTGASSTSIADKAIKDQDTFVRVLSLLPAQMKNSDAEKAMVKDWVKKYTKQGLSPDDIVDKVSGYVVDNKTPLSQSLRGLLAQGSNTSTSDYAAVARELNSGNTVSAIRKVENTLYDDIKKNEGQNYISEPYTKTLVQSYAEVMNLINQLNKTGQNPIGNFSGTLQEWAGRFKGKAAADLASRLVNSFAKWRNAIAGSAITATELKYLNDAVPQLSDSAANFSTKYKNTVNQVLRGLNSQRTQYDMPELNADQVVDENKKVEAYSSYSGQKFGSTTSGSDIKSLAESKGFDYQAAKNAGYSDEEIKQYLNQ